MRISPERNAFSGGGRKARRHHRLQEISPTELYFAINSSYVCTDLLHSGMLPEHCLSIAMNSSEKRFVLWYPERYADLIYRETELPHFPIPRMVFAIRMLDTGPCGGLRHGWWWTMSPPDTGDSHVPLSPGQCPSGCPGLHRQQRHAKIQESQALRHFPRYLLGLPCNDDLFDRNHNRKGLDHRALLEHLRDKPPEYYYTDILVPNGSTLNDLYQQEVIPMERKTTSEIQAALAQPFAAEDLEWRLQMTFEDSMKGIAVPYVTNRAIMNGWTPWSAQTAGSTTTGRGTAAAKRTPSSAASPSTLTTAAG